MPREVVREMEGTPMGLRTPVTDAIRQARARIFDSGTALGSPTNCSERLGMNTGTTGALTASPTPPSPPPRFSLSNAMARPSASRCRNSTSSAVTDREKNQRTTSEP
jgi:hypothetical protein